MSQDVNSYWSLSVHCLLIHYLIKKGQIRYTAYVAEWKQN